MPVLADLDGDDDPDLILGDKIMSNEHWSAIAPLLARPGQRYVLHWRAPAGASGTALPFFSDQPAWIPAPPFGTLGLLPGSAFLLPPVPLLNGEGEAAYNLPADPRLLGVTVHAQALLATPAAFHLSPVVRERIGG